MSKHRNPMDIREAAREVGSAVEKAKREIVGVMGYRHVLGAVPSTSIFLAFDKTNLYFKLVHLESVLTDLDQELRALKERQA